jgi:hypothetical protein
MHRIEPILQPDPARLPPLSADAHHGIPGFVIGLLTGGLSPPL